MDSKKIIENYCGAGQGVLEGLEVAKAIIYECPGVCSEGVCQLK